MKSAHLSSEACFPLGGPALQRCTRLYSRGEGQVTTSCAHWFHGLCRQIILCLVDPERRRCGDVIGLHVCNFTGFIARGQALNWMHALYGGAYRDFRIEACKNRLDAVRVYSPLESPASSNRSCPVSQGAGLHSTGHL